MEHHKLPHPLIAVLPVILLICFVSVAVYLFGADALNGASQMALLLAAAFCLLLGKLTVNAHWHDFEKQLQKNFKNISGALLILFVIGSLSATWMISGVVPLFIVYGLKIIHPAVFLISACVISALVSVLTGSSWTTIATIGVALLGIGTALGFSSGWIAGAIISGAYFGDKVSPLSDTTVLASSVSGTPLFTHIRYMMITTIPSFLISLLVFGIAGLLMKEQVSVDAGLYEQVLNERFNLSPWLLLVPALTVFLIVRRYPPLITLFISMLIALVCAYFFQPDLLFEVAESPRKSMAELIKGGIITMVGKTSIESGYAEINELIATRGMQGMLNTVWIIICATCFGAAMASTRMIESFTLALVKKIRNTFGLVGSTVATGLLTNLTMGDQYLGIILTGNMFKKLYEEQGYENRLLSRSLEDSVTVTSVLVPWNSCGMTQSTVLGVSTLIYLPYAVFNYVSPLMSVLIALLKYKIIQGKSEQSKSESV
ncbi:MAG: Na+/H+ antiporter NhaC family protein [Paludibacter sp.]|jgi:NhaC family Na+:H+ antiporter|nr:Na+/H+ antiporter NhaC family protein [Paludibacter sp.]